MINVLQLIALTPLLNVHFPGNVNEFVSYLALTNGEPKFVPNYFEEMMLDKDAVKRDAHNRQFYNMGFKTNNFLINCGRKILLHAALAACLPILTLLAMLFQNKCRLM